MYRIETPRNAQTPEVCLRDAGKEFANEWTLEQLLLTTHPLIPIGTDAPCRCYIVMSSHAEKKEIAQNAERIPNAFALLAQSLDLDVADLCDLIERGQVDLSHFIDKEYVQSLLHD